MFYSYVRGINFWRYRSIVKEEQNSFMERDVHGLLMHFVLYFYSSLVLICCLLYYMAVKLGISP